MLATKDLLDHNAFYNRQEEMLGKRPSPPPNTFIDPNNPFQLDLLILDIEWMAPERRKPYLQSFGFSEEAAEAIVADISHDQRVNLAYLESVRIQAQRATDGLPEVPRPEDSYPVKTLIFGNSVNQHVPAETTSKEIEAKSDQGPCGGVVIDHKFDEIPFESASDEQAVSPQVAVPAAVTAQPVTTPKKTKLPEDVICIRNAHYPKDRAGTILQGQLVKWVPNIKSLPKQTVFDLFGEMNGEMVDLVFYVNRERSTCYVGNHFKNSARGCRVRWDDKALGPLPVKGAKLLLRVISINPREVSP